jgi:prepilin-type N-terminal cleavage/methylation domain-containing protein
MKLPFTIYDLRFTIWKKSAESAAVNRQSSIINPKFPGAFTLIEMLVVISILGILAALTVPALKNFGKSDVNLSASRQMLDGVARARQLAISQRTTIYMVFVPTNFWLDDSLTFPNNWWTGLTPAQTNAAVNLCSEQLSGYNFLAYGAMGDQPGEHAWHYLAPWQTLPDGSFIALQKFAGTNTIIDPITSAQYNIARFHYTNNFPFPTESSPVENGPHYLWLPYLAFNYLGQLVSEVDAAGNYNDAYIPLAHGSVLPAINPNTKALQVGTGDSPDVAESPPGNSTNISYNIVHINWLTGRAVLERHKMGP